MLVNKQLNMVRQKLIYIFLDISPIYRVNAIYLTRLEQSRFYLTLLRTQLITERSAMVVIQSLFFFYRRQTSWREKGRKTKREKEKKERERSITVYSRVCFSNKAHAEEVRACQSKIISNFKRYYAYVRVSLRETRMFGSSSIFAD